jgi:hypothetical protein
VLHQGVGDAQARQFHGQEVVGAAVEIGLEDHMVPGPEHRQQGHGLGGHARGHHQAVRRAFQGGDLFGRGDLGGDVGIAGIAVGLPAADVGAHVGRGRMDGRGHPAHPPVELFPGPAHRVSGCRA